MSETSLPNHLLSLTSQIVAAHLGNNTVPTTELPRLIKAVHSALTEAETPTVVAAVKPQAPAVPIKKSVFPDYIVCLEDGKKLKILKRHLQVSYGLTPDQYRAKWGLPHDYPMVAPTYAATRSGLAKKIGLGRKLITKAPVPAPAPASRRAYMKRNRNAAAA